MKLLQKEISKNRFVYALLGVILLGALFVRIYRTDQILGFYFDQGRDANVIWDFLYNGKFFLIGPTTGIAGIFRGPLYYYLIAPFYWLGNGNPSFPAVFLAITSVLAIALAYWLGKILHSRAAGIFVSILASFSFFMMLAGRWLSNPTPMLLLSVLLLWMMVLIVQKKKWPWYAIALLSGISLFHFGSSGEFFYFPALFVFALWQRKTWPKPKGILLCIFLFLLTAAPLIIFDIRHDGILLGNIKKFFVDDQSFKASFWQVANTRLHFYYEVVVSKLYPTHRNQYFLWMIGISFLIFLPSLLKNKFTRILILLLASPTIGLLFFQGNFGNIYDYYLTGYYMLFLLLIGILLAKIWQFLPGKIAVIIFFYLFLVQNLDIVKAKITDKVDGPETIALGNQTKALDWIYKDAQNQDFNVDVYVPPVIPHAYTYLFNWYGGRVKSKLPSSVTHELLYTLYEVDSPHPERLEVWLARQKGIGTVEKEAKFGGITVQRRKRL